MFKLSKTRTKKISINGLKIDGTQFYDKDGELKDLNRIILAAYEDGDTFDFTVTNKIDDSEIIDEESGE